MTGETLLLGEDGRSGSGYEYLMARLEDSVTDYLTRLDAGILPAAYSSADYISGNYIYKAPAPAPGPKPGGDKDEIDLLQGHAGPGVALQKPPFPERDGGAAEPG